MRFSSHAATLSLLLTALAACQKRGEFPDRPLLLICPWAVGGGTDAASRQMAIFLEKDLGVPVNVVNATGGAGVTGHSRGASARPDGYTLTMMTVEINMLRWRRLTDISWEDFAPLMLINREAAALFVRNDAPWKNLAELTEEVRENPGKLHASGTSIGGIWHLALAGWLTAAGLNPGDIKWIPKQGAGPSLAELASRGLHMVCCSLPEARTLLLGGEVRALGVMAPERVKGYEQVPTFAEQGFDWSLAGWRGLGVPAATPQPVQDALVASLRRIVTGETIVRIGGEAAVEKTFPGVMAEMQADASWEPPPEFRETLRRTDGELGKLLTSEEFRSLTKGRFRPMDFPYLLFAVAGVVLLLLVAGRWVAPSAAQTDRVRPTTRGAVHALELIVAVSVFILLAERLGFILTAGSLLFFLLWRLGSRWWVSAAITLFLVPTVYWLFSIRLRVPLPRGFLEW